MLDDLPQRRRDDGLRIFASNPHELRWWSKKLAVPVERLKQALIEVGPYVVDVERHLREED
jgi:hypothetical protein